MINHLSIPKLDFVFAIVNLLKMESLTKIYDKLKALYLQDELLMISKSNVERLRELLADIDEIFKTSSEKIVSFSARNKISNYKQNLSEVEEDKEDFDTHITSWLMSLQTASHDDITFGVSDLPYSKEP